MYSPMERWVEEPRQEQPWISLSGFSAFEDSEMNLSSIEGQRADTISLGSLEPKEARSGEGRRNERI
jgi:hypothetical protein